MVNVFVLMYLLLALNKSQTILNAQAFSVATIELKL